jgi:predicted phosphodiesterase
MQRVAALYDIHGNLPALEAVLEDVRREGVDAIVVGGDVMPGPMPTECLELIYSTGIQTEFIRGNGESAMFEALRGGPLERVPEPFREGIRWGARELPDEYVAALTSWPLMIAVFVEGLGRVLFCHATPRNDTEIFTKLSPPERIEAMFAGVDPTIAICGHTHMQFDMTIGNLRIVNAGSVGSPFADPGAYWALLGNDVELRRTSYDVEAAASLIRGTGFPGAARFADSVLRPHPESEMLALYAKADGRGGLA